MNRTFESERQKLKPVLFENYLADHDRIFTGSRHYEWVCLRGCSHGSPIKSKMAAAYIFNFGKKNVNNSGLDKDTCTKFYGKMHHSHAKMTTWPKVETGSWFVWRHQINAWSLNLSDQCRYFYPIWYRAQIPSWISEKCQ